MGRITSRKPLIRVSTGSEPITRMDSLAVEEPLEVRVDGNPLTVTMRTPGHDAELATGFLVSEGIVRAFGDVQSTIHCGGPGSGGRANEYNTLNMTLSASATERARGRVRTFVTTSACGVCGSDSIDAITHDSVFDLREDQVALSTELLAVLPDRLRAGQSVFDKTGGLHAAGLFDARTGELLVLREDVGRHNAVDKVIGWALMQDRLPLGGVVLQVSGRASFELVQKAVMAGIPALAAVSAPSSLAVDLAERSGLTLVGFSRGSSMNIYTGSERVSFGPAPAEAPLTASA